MKDVLQNLNRWREQGETIAVATVVNTWGSAPRPIGAKLVTTASGGMDGSVSAGCVEGAVIEAGRDVMASGKAQLLHFGVADDEAWDVGLACGGEIEVLVEPFEALGSVYDAATALLEAREPFALVSVLGGGDAMRNRKLIVREDGATEGPLALGGEHTPRAVEAALDFLARETGGVVEVEGGPTLFVETYPTAPRLIIVGAVHMADALVSMAATLGFDTIIVDPRAAFATRERFPHATELVREWPQHALPAMKLNHSAYIAVLTHDPKLDDPALEAALTSDARYVGALGSRRTNRRRVERLRAAGLTDEQLARLRAPIGLDIGGRAPAEIALSILAEITQVRHSSPVRLPDPQPGPQPGP